MRGVREEGLENGRGQSHDPGILSSLESKKRMTKK